MSTAKPSREKRVEKDKGYTNKDEGRKRKPTGGEREGPMGNGNSRESDALKIEGIFVKT